MTEKSAYWLWRIVPHKHRWTTTADAYYVVSLFPKMLPGHAWKQPSRCVRCRIERDRIIDCPPDAACVSRHPTLTTHPTHKAPEETA